MIKNKQEADELRKCVASPYYFFTKYVLIDGKPATTMLSEETFNDYFKAMTTTNYSGTKRKLDWLKKF
jgi:hypothetical protein